MKLFGSEKVASIADMMGVPEDMPIEMNILTSTIEKAQKRIEGINYSIRKNVLEYDDVMNKQREIIYNQRKEVLKSDDISTMILSMSKSNLNEIIDLHLKDADSIEDVDFELVNTLLLDLFKIDDLINKDDIKQFDEDVILDDVYNKIENIYLGRINKSKEEGSYDNFNSLQKQLMLRVVDEKWMDHIDNITGLKEGINLRAYGQTNPVEAYKMESFTMFEDMVESIKEDTIKYIFGIKERLNVVLDNNVAQITGYDNVHENKKTGPVKVTKEAGRNELCPCGSGKKYKHCCGK